MRWRPCAAGTPSRNSTSTGSRSPSSPVCLQSHARLRQKLRIPIAIGENYFTRFQFYEAIRNGCADIVQPDNRRAGGITEWMDIAAISETAGVKLASHLGGPATSTSCAPSTTRSISSARASKGQRNARASARNARRHGSAPDGPRIGRRNKAGVHRKVQA